MSTEALVEHGVAGMICDRPRRLLFRPGGAGSPRVGGGAPEGLVEEVCHRRQTSPGWSPVASPHNVRLRDIQLQLFGLGRSPAGAGRSLTGCVHRAEVLSQDVCDAGVERVRAVPERGAVAEAFQQVERAVPG